jgi:hypothetical protein
MLPPVQLRAPQDDLAERCLFASFNADEVLGQLRQILDKNLKSRSTHDRILREIQSRLVKTAWSDKLDKILESLRTLASQSQTQAPDLAAVTDEIYDILAYLQALAGLNPTLAEQSGITHDFYSAFRFMATTIRRFGQNWPESSTASNLFRMTRQRLLASCYRTFAEMVNVNLPYFESAESLSRCLLMVIDLDPTGVTAPFFCTQIQTFSDRFNVAVIRARGSNHQLASAIKAAHRAGEDITAAVRELPDDSRKFMVLQQVGLKTDPASYSPLLMACAVNSRDPDVITHGMNLFPKEPDFRAHYFDRLSECLSHWLNELLKRQNVKDPVVLKAYAPVRELMMLFRDDTRARVFATVREREDLTQALAMLVRKGIIDANGAEPMAVDIMSIVRPCLPG